jgi:hypothetical protein
MRFRPDSIEPKEDVVVATCSKCQGEIYLYNEYGEDEEGKIICHHCIETMWDTRSLAEKFEIFGYNATYQTLEPKKVRVMS